MNICSIVERLLMALEGFLSTLLHPTAVQRHPSNLSTEYEGLATNHFQTSATAKKL